MPAYDHLEPYLSSESQYFIFEHIVPNLKQDLNTLLHHEKSNDKPRTLNELFTHQNPSIARLALTCYSHLFWQKSLSLAQTPSDDVLAKIFASFGSIEKFYLEINKLATYDVRYIYVIKDKDKLNLLSDKVLEADPTQAATGVMVLAINLWEHAYYLDYRQRRDDYLKDHLEKLINWSAVRTALFAAKSVEFLL